jgi:hypothetical protein
MPSTRTLRLALFPLLACAAIAPAQTLLRPADYHHYIQTFEADEQLATGHLYNGEPSTPGQQPESAWPWMQREIPWFDCSDKSFEEMYYFRWYAWKKHLVHTPSGYIITEWLPKPNLPDFGALPDAAPFHLNEARWLHTRAIAEDDARFWYDPNLPGPNSAAIRKYSAPMANAVRDVTLANGDTALATSLLPELVRVYHDWERTQQDSNGLFWSIDTRDAMEKSISGDGYRPTLNSYMVSDARAIIATALLAGNTHLAAEFTVKALHLNSLIETLLWNPHDQFYEVLSPAKDSGIRAQKKFIDPGTVLQFSGVRELIGYNPWAYSSPAPSHAIAWRQLFDPQGFDGKFGATTAERRSPRFRFASSDQCTWNGPAWPFAMTQTLTALANFLNTPGPHTIAAAAYDTLFSRYVLAQHINVDVAGKPLPHTIDWIDEDYDADTDQWIAKSMLLAKNKQVGRGNYYNHSGFADPLITGLIGLRPRPDNHIVVHPLAPASWTWFAIDALPYHGHLLTIAYDATGTRYHHGRGLFLAVDGHTIAHRATLGSLEADLPK